MSVLTDTLINPTQYTAYAFVKNSGGTVVGRFAVFLLEQDAGYDVNDVMTAMAAGVAAAGITGVASMEVQRKDLSYTTL